MLEEAYAVWSLFPLVVLGARASAVADERCSSPGEDNAGVWLWTVDEYPHPVHHPRYCNRFAPSFVCDPDRILCKKEADALDKLIERIRNETLCICRFCESIPGPRGITLGVAILEHLHRTPDQLVADAVREFAEKLRRRWALGHCDDDIILLVSTSDAQSYTLVGPAVAGLFPQEVADQIYLESRGHFSSALYYQGLQSMIQSYFDMLRRLQGQGMMFRQSDGGGSTVGLIVGVVFGSLALLTAIAAGVFWYGSRNWDYNYLVTSLAESTRKGRRRLANLRRRRRPPATPPATAEDDDHKTGNNVLQEVTCPSTVVSVPHQSATPNDDQREGAGSSSEGSQSATCTDDEDYSSEEDDSASSSSSSEEVRGLKVRGSARATEAGSSPVLHTPL